MFDTPTKSPKTQPTFAQVFHAQNISQTQPSVEFVTSLNPPLNP